MTENLPPAPPGPPAGAQPPAVQLNLDHYRQTADQIKEEQDKREGGGLKWDRPAKEQVCFITAGNPGWRCVRLIGPYNARGILERSIYQHWNIPGYKYPIPSLNTWPQLGVEDPIDRVLTDLKNREIEFNNRMWSSQKVVINGIKRLWNPTQPGLVTGQWDPEEHDTENKGAAGVNPHIISLPTSVWNWLVGQISTLLAQPTPINPASLEFGFDLFFTKKVSTTKQGDERTEYLSPGFMMTPGPVVSDPAHLEQLRANIIDLDTAYPPPPDETIQKLHDIADKLRAHYMLTSAGPMTFHPGAPPEQPAAMKAPPPMPATTAAAPPVEKPAAAVPQPPVETPPPPVEQPAAVAEPVVPPAEEPKFYVHVNGAVQEKGLTEFRVIVTADPNVQAMRYNQEGGWVSGSTLIAEVDAPASPPIQALPEATIDFNDPGVARGFTGEGIKGQYDGKKVDPMSRPLEDRIPGDTSAQVAPDREHCYGLDHDPRKRNVTGRTEQGEECMLCESEPSCRLIRIKRDPEFYAAIGFTIDENNQVTPNGTPGPT